MPMPLMAPEARYFSMPSFEAGGAVTRRLALNCRPWVRSFTQLPSAVIISPAATCAAVPTMATGCGRPRTRTFSTAKPVAGEWKVTRSIVPVRVSTGLSDGDGAALARMAANRG